MSRPTEPFRREHVGIKEHLEHLNAEVGKLSVASPSEQRASMQHVVDFVREHIKPHAEWEERVLYPAVDRRAASGPNPFTASMRYEHRIVVRWTDELAAIAAAPAADITAFARRADNLLGLIWAHFEEEEEVLLPILDRTMSREDFEREIGGHHTTPSH
jgi:hemerythrin-like domain-containing protein